jgi:uncharacterized CHY-type Zn-finger protein
MRADQEESVMEHCPICGRPAGSMEIVELDTNGDFWMMCPQCEHEWNITCPTFETLPGTPDAPAGALCFEDMAAQ